jgi:hypothetical protein
VNLLKKDNFKWAKKILTSETHSIIQEDKSSKHSSLQFSLPFDCPNSDPICLGSNSVDKENLEISQEPSTPDQAATNQQTSLSTIVLLPRKKKERQITLVDSELRRSLRIKAYNPGFKPSGCGKKNCLGCDMDPPSLSTRVIRNLGANFYKVTPENLSDAALRAPKSSNRIVNAQSKKANGKVVAPSRKPLKPDNNINSNGRNNKMGKQAVKK